MNRRLFLETLGLAGTMAINPVFAADAPKKDSLQDKIKCVIEKVKANYDLHSFRQKDEVTTVEAYKKTVFLENGKKATLELRIVKDGTNEVPIFEINKAATKKTPGFRLIDYYANGLEKNTDPEYKDSLVQLVFDGTKPQVNEGDKYIPSELNSRSIEMLNTDYMNFLDEVLKSGTLEKPGEKKEGEMLGVIN